MTVIDKPATLFRTEIRRRELEAARLMDQRPNPNPHVDVHNPQSIHCDPVSQNGVVTFENHGPHNVRVNFSDWQLFHHDDATVPAHGALDLSVQVEECEATYTVTPMPAFTLQTYSTMGTMQTMAGSDPKDIIVP